MSTTRVFVKKVPIEAVASLRAELNQCGIKHRFIWSGPRYVYSPLKGRYAEKARRGNSCCSSHLYTLKVNATSARLYFVY